MGIRVARGAAWSRHINKSAACTVLVLVLVLPKLDGCVPPLRGSYCTRTVWYDDDEIADEMERRFLFTDPREYKD